MKSDIELLDAAKALTGSDSETGRKLGINQGNISGIRNGRRELSAAQAGEIAEMIGSPWINEALPRLAKKEKSAKSSRYWLGKLQKRHAIGLMAVLVGLSAMIPVHGVTDYALPYAVEAPNECILCGVGDYLLTALGLAIFWPQLRRFAQKTTFPGAAVV